jgi:DNA-binding NarL/FixJ family response regulator
VPEERFVETGLFRILIVDDYEPFRRFVCSTLRSRSELKVIDEVSDGLEAVQQAQDLQPDLILLDIGLPTLNGIEAARRTRSVSPASKILFISENRSADIAREAFSTGAGGYVVKSDAANDLLPAVDAVLKGKRFVSASLAGHDLVTSQAGAFESADHVESNPYLRFAGNGLIPEFLASVIDATAADFGNIQLFDTRYRVLRIVVQHGFESEFLEYFDTVRYDDQCVCGHAMKQRFREVIPDVASDPLFSSESRGVLLRAKVRSVQSTPLFNPLGKFVGMVSTHRSRPGSPMPDVLVRVDNLCASFLAKIEA